MGKIFLDTAPDMGKTLPTVTNSRDRSEDMNTAQLENDTFVPNTANELKISGGGRTGLALDEGRGGCMC